MSPQDKLMVVANRLGLTTLKDMQGSTGAIYDCDLELSNNLFSRCSQHDSPTFTNLNQNKFEVNEALLIETIGLYVQDDPQQGPPNLINLDAAFPDDNMIVFDVVIGNKRVIKEQPIYVNGGPTTFATVANPATQTRHQLYLESVGIVIPPQVEFSINYDIYNFRTGAKVTIEPLQSSRIGAYIFGTKVNLNFNTTL